MCVSGYVCVQTAGFLCVGGENVYKSKVSALKCFIEVMHYFYHMINDTDLLLYLFFLLKKTIIKHFDAIMSVCPRACC